MLLRVMRALALSASTLGCAAMIVDARADRGLPEGFPFLAELRGVGDVLERLGDPAPTPSQDAEGLPRSPEGVVSTASALPGEIMNPGALPIGVVPGEGTDPDLPTAPSGVRVNRGLPWRGLPAPGGTAMVRVMYDFLVIGGGIAGISAAARLSSLGSVLLLEAEVSLAHHASSRSAAIFEETYGAPSTVALNRASRPELETRGVLSPRGLLMVARAEDAAPFESDLRGLEMEEIGLAEARRLLPTLGAEVAQAAYQRNTMDLDADRLLQGFLREARANGAQVETRRTVTAIRRTAGGWTVEAGEAFEARVLVDAAGPWADAVAGMAGLPPLGLTPLRRSMARIPSPLDPSSWPMVIGAGEAWYMKPDAGALLVSPAEEDPAEPHDAWADDMVLAEGLARFEAHVTLEVARLLASWAGLRTFAPDRQLVLGPDPLDAAFLWCAGQGGYGFQTACAASRHLREVAGGARPTLGPEVAAALSPARLRA